MADFINTVDVIGDDALTDSIIMKTITEFKDNNVKTVGKYAFSSCTVLALVDLPNATKVDSNAFEGCTVLQTLILRGNAVATLGGTNAFNRTPIASGEGYIYVPAALVNSYKAATNWSTYAAQFRALEDYTVDGTITGEIDESKI